MAIFLSGCGLSDAQEMVSDLRDRVESITENDSGAEGGAASSDDGTGISFRGIMDGIKESTWSTEEAATNLDGFYRSQLSDDCRNVYDQMYTGIAAKKKEFYVKCTAVDDIGRALRAVMNDHPEFFWLNGEAQIYGQSGGGKERVTLTFNVDGSQIDEIRTQIEAAANEFLASLPSDASAYQKVRRTYEYIIKNTDYSTNASQNQNIQSVFLYHKSVCAGYAKAFQYLLNKAGVPCYYVYGSIAGNNAAHAWNLVRIGDTYTYVDTTWGDPTYGENAEDSKRLSIIYDYLCLTTEEMTRSGHVLNADYSYPDCTSRTYDFYMRLNDYFDSYDGNSIQSHLYASVDQGDSITYLKFGSAEVYRKALDNLFGRNGLISDPLQRKMSIEHTRSMQYYYSKSDDLWTIKIFW